MCAPAIAIAPIVLGAVSTVASVGMGIMQSNQSVAQANAQMNMVAQQQQESIAHSNRQQALQMEQW